MTNGGLYFLPWLTQNTGVSVGTYNAIALVVTSMALLISGPVLGRLYDRSNRRSVYLFLTSLVMFAATLGIHLADQLSQTSIAKGTNALICFCVLMYCYQLSLIFYNSRLNEIATPQDYAKISGRGAAAGWVGALLGIILVLPFVDGTVPFIHGSGEAKAFLPSAMFYGIGTAISLVLMRGISTGRRSSSRVPLSELFSQTWRDIRMTIKLNNVLYFLLALFLFADAVLTIENNASYYLAEVMHYSENAKATLFALLLIMAAVGSLVSAKLAQKVSLKKLLIGILIAWSVTLIMVSITRNHIAFAVEFSMVGFLFGSQATVARTLFLMLLPPHRTGEYFGMFVSFWRFATCIGPVVWVAAAYGFRQWGVDAYRASMIAMAILIIISLAFLRKVVPSAQNAS